MYKLLQIAYKLNSFINSFKYFYKPLLNVYILVKMVYKMFILVIMVYKMFILFIMVYKLFVRNYI